MNKKKFIGSETDDSDFKSPQRISPTKRKRHQKTSTSLQSKSNQSKNEKSITNKHQGKEAMDSEMEFQGKPIYIYLFSISLFFSLYSLFNMYLKNLTFCFK